MKSDPIRAVAWWAVIAFCLGFWAAVFRLGAKMVERVL